MRVSSLLVAVAALVFATACGGDSSDDGTGPSNAAPVISVPASVDAIRGQTISFVVTASDPEGDEFTLTVGPVITTSELRLGISPGVSSFDPDTGEVEFTPNENDVPQRIFEAVAKDDAGSESTERFAVAVNEP